MFICVSVSGIVYFAERKLITGGTRKNQTAQMTGGLVQEFEHEVLPSIKPIHTMVLSVVLMLVRKTKDLLMFLKILLAPNVNLKRLISIHVHFVIANFY